MPPLARVRRSRLVLGASAVALLLLVLLWDWNWFRPLVEGQASRALGREVRLKRFDIDLGRHTVISGEGIVIDNPQGFAPGSRFGEIGRLALTVDLRSLFGEVPRIPRIAAERFRFDLAPGPDGTPNWKFPEKDETPEEQQKAGVAIGALELREGRVNVRIPAQKSDFALAIRTEPAAGAEAQLRIDAEGTYAGQPVTGRFIGGSALGLREPAQPYPVDLEALNGQTRVRLQGTIDDPLNFGDARLDLLLTGDDLEELYPLTGIPLPPTPAYELKGALQLTRQQVRFDDFQGRVGSSDIAGDLVIDLAREKRLITATLESQKLSMVDLAGFVGATPGKEGEAGDTRDQQQMRAADEARPRVLPDRTISLPKIRAADLDIRFEGKRIESDWLPIDNLQAHLVVQDGYLRVKPLRFGVGEGGQIAANIELDGRQDLVRTVADVDFRRIGLNRVMRETRMFEGAGLIGGMARLESRGNSLSDMLGNGDGELKLFMTQGELSALLVNLAGLEFGNALLSALGLPRKTEVRCLVTDLALEDGVLRTRTMLLDTGVSNLFIKGSINLRNEALDLTLRSQPKRFGLATFKSPIHIEGTMKKPDLGVEADELAGRGGAVAALSALLGPLGALLPTVDLGLGKDHNCKALIDSVGAADSALKRGGIAPPENGGGKAAPDSQPRKRDRPAPRKAPASAPSSSATPGAREASPASDGASATPDREDPPQPEKDEASGSPLPFRPGAGAR